MQNGLLVLLILKKVIKHWKSWVSRSQVSKYNFSACL